MASIRKRGDKWQAQIRKDGYPPLNKTFIHKADAERWSRHTESAIERGERATDKPSLKEQTLNGLLIRYRDSITVTKRGAQAEAYRIGTMLSHSISDLPLSKLTAASVD